MGVEPARLSGLVVTGTDTGVGKTAIITRLVRLWRARGIALAALKPIASGGLMRDGELVSDDTLALQAALGGEPPARLITPLVYEAPLAPNLAARAVNHLLFLDEIVRGAQACIQEWPTPVTHVLIEGVGGFSCPIAEDATFADLAIVLDFPVLVVARAGLGTLNHTMLTVEAIQRRGLRVAGIVLNAPSPEIESDRSRHGNPAELARRLGGVGPIVSVCYNEQALDPDPGLSSLDPTNVSQPARTGIFAPNTT